VGWSLKAEGARSKTLALFAEGGQRRAVCGLALRYGGAAAAMRRQPRLALLALRLQ